METLNCSSALLLSPALPVPDSPIALTCIGYLGDCAGSNPLAADGVGLAIVSCTVSLRWGHNLRNRRSRDTDGTEEHCTQAHSHKNPRVTPVARELWYFRRVRKKNLCGRRSRYIGGPIQQAQSCGQPSCDLSQEVLYLPPSARGIMRRGQRKTFAVSGIVGAVVAADCGGRHAELLVLVALAHRYPHPRIVRAQLQAQTSPVSLTSLC